MRLYNYLKKNANLTRKKLLQLYTEEKILVNNTIVPLSCPLQTNDQVTIDGKIIENIPFSYYLYYKPKGIRSDITFENCSYVNYIDQNIKLNVVGRLDKDSEGLMILTNDGNFHHLINQHNIEKTYLVTLKEKVTPEFLEKIVLPIEIKHKKTLPMIVERVNDYQIILILHDGKYHQIRRACILNHNHCEKLLRLSIGPFNLDDMKPNELKPININDYFSFLSTK